MSTTEELLATATVNTQELYNAGKDAENKAFWDALIWEGLNLELSTDKYKHYGRHSLASAFASWEPECFKPTKIIQVGQQSSTTNSMQAAFRSFGKNTPEGTDINLPELLSAHGGGLNLKYVYDARYMFQYSNFTELGTIDVETVSANNTRGMFDGCTRLRQVTLKNVNTKTNSLSTNALFANCSSLTSLIFENSLIQVNIDLSYSPLNKPSIISTINALSDSVTGQTCTLSLEAVNKVFETTEGANDGSTSTEWAGLIATKSNWTISLSTIS